MSRPCALLVAVAVLAASCSGSDAEVARTDDATNTTLIDTTDPNTAPVDTMSPSTGAAPTSSAAAGADGVGDSFYPQMGNGGYDVEHYALDLDVDVESNTIDATTTIDATATIALSSFNLDLEGLEVEVVSVDGTVAGFERVGGELTVTPVAAIPDEASFVVQVDYSGTPQPVVDPANPVGGAGWFMVEDTVFVASEPSGAPSWFPSNDHPSDKATFEFVITADAALTAVANGVMTGTETVGNRATTTWVMDDPMTTDLAAVYIGEFELRESTTDDGLRIRNYFPPAFADDLEADFALTADVISFYEDLFDADYPFEEYGSIVVPFSLGFALENQTISIHGLDATDPDTIAHEILHQWAGNSVTVARWQDIWLLEGFATYLSYMYAEDRGRNSTFEPRGMYAALSGTETVGPAEVPLEELFGLSVYFRGGMALHALRTEVGDETFRELLVAYYARNAGERISTEEFQAIVEEIAGTEARAVLDSWLFGTELPDFPS